MWHMVDKRTNSATEAVQDISSGSSIAVGGFGLVGIPTVLIEAYALRVQMTSPSCPITWVLMASA